MSSFTDLQRSNEEDFIKRFVQKSQQDRCLLLLGSAKQRFKLTGDLAHFTWLDERYAHSIPAKSAHTVKEISQLLRNKGSGSRGWVISEQSSIDGQELVLEDALTAIWGQGMGSVLSCIPGKLAYFENEDIQRLLER